MAVVNIVTIPALFGSFLPKCALLDNCINRFFRHNIFGLFRFVLITKISIVYMR